jgi:hypothetical protein
VRPSSISGYSYLVAPNQEHAEEYIPRSENYGLLKFTASIHELSINLD